MDQGQLTGDVFIDLRKAFDTVNSAVLLDKLSNLGIVAKENRCLRTTYRTAPTLLSFMG